MKNLFNPGLKLLLSMFIIFVGCNNQPSGDVNRGSDELPPIEPIEIPEVVPTIEEPVITRAVENPGEIEGVYLTVKSIDYNLDDTWIEATTFKDPETINLLELSGKKFTLLESGIKYPGVVTQIRFMLPPGKRKSGKTGCYIAIDPDGVADGDESDNIYYELFVPSGRNTGYKTDTVFTVPINGDVDIYPNFDINNISYEGEEGEGFYKLEPKIELIVDREAGTISGTFLETTNSYLSYRIFAFGSGFYGGLDDAVTSSEAKDTYTLLYLAPGTYDLVIAGTNDYETYSVINRSYRDIVVKSRNTTKTDIIVDIDY